jgi:hypothetical protein
MNQYVVALGTGNGAATTKNRARTKVVVAPDTTTAKRIAGGGAESWDLGASAALIDNSAGWAGWGAHVKVATPAGVNILDVTVLTPTSYQVTAGSLDAGGEGYAVGDKLLLTGAAGDTDAEFEVATAAIGEAATMTISAAGSFTPDLGDKTAVATTALTGTGTGLTLDLTTTGGGPYTVSGATVVAGGQGYEVGDTVSAAGATDAVFAVATVDGAIGEVLTITFNSGGAYAASPNSRTATTSDGDGTGATLNTVTSEGGGAGDIDALGLDVAAAINADSGLIAAAAFNSSSNVLTVAGAGDGIGDHTVTFELIPPGCSGGITAPVGTITDEGVAGAALTVALPADAYEVPFITSRLKGV